MNSIPDRDLRQRDIILPTRLVICKPTVIGVGAVGRQVALQLSAMGVPCLQLVDHDLVEPVNLASQAFLEEDLGRWKVQATADLCSKLNSNVLVSLHPVRFRRSLSVGNAVFCCVDSIDTRKLVWESVKDRTSFFADGRMSAEVLRVLVAADETSREHYPTTLFSQEEAFVGSCTAKSTIFCANIAAGLMLSQFAKWLRNLPVEPDVCLNLLASEMTALTPG